MGFSQCRVNGLRPVIRGMELGSPFCWFAYWSPPNYGSLQINVQLPSWASLLKFSLIMSITCLTLTWAPHSLSWSFFFQKHHPAGLPAATSMYLDVPWPSKVLSFDQGAKFLPGIFSCLLCKVASQTLFRAQVQSEPFRNALLYPRRGN